MTVVYYVKDKRMHKQEVKLIKLKNLPKLLVIMQGNIYAHYYISVTI